MQRNVSNPVFAVFFEGVGFWYAWLLTMIQQVPYVGLIDGG